MMEQISLITIYILSTLGIIAGIILIVNSFIIKKKKQGEERTIQMGLEKFYPFIMLIFGLFLILLILAGKISESTFNMFFGIILGVFVTAFKDVLEIIKKK